MWPAFSKANAPRIIVGAELMEMIEFLGFSAGAITLVSSVPQLIANLRNQELAMAQSLSRNCLQSVGNGLWLGYGVTVGSASMTTMSSGSSVARQRVMFSMPIASAIAAKSLPFGVAAET